MYFFNHTREFLILFPYFIKEFSLFFLKFWYFQNLITSPSLLLRFFPLCQFLALHRVGGMKLATRWMSTRMKLIRFHSSFNQTALLSAIKSTMEITTPRAHGLTLLRVPRYVPRCDPSYARWCICRWFATTFALIFDKMPRLTQGELWPSFFSKRGTQDITFPFYRRYTKKLCDNTFIIKEIYTMFVKSKFNSCVEMYKRRFKSSLVGRIMYTYIGNVFTSEYWNIFKS